MECLIVMNSRFKCDEYLSEFASSGFYHEESYLQLVYPKEDVFINHESGHLVIGSAGADGIEFCFRAHLEGVWAYYPIEMSYKFISGTVKELIEGYCNGNITV